MVSTRRSAAIVVQKELTTSVENKSQPQLSLDERLSILSKPKNVTQPVLKRVPSTTLQPVIRRPSLATMKSAGSFAKPKLSSTDLQVSEEESALASLTRTDSLHKLISAPAPPPSTYKYVSSSGYGQSTGAPIRRSSIIVAAANAKASLSTVKSAPPPPPSSSKTNSSSFNRSSSFSRRASFSSSQLSLSFVAASSRKPTSSVSRMAMTTPSVDADTDDDELPSPLRRTLLAVISSSCLEAANLTQRGLFAAARTAYEALLTEVPLARRRAEVWIARASLESTAGDNAEGMDMLLKGAEACRAVPTEHTKITAALSSFARSAISGGTAVAIPILALPSSTSSPLQKSKSTSKNEEDDDPFLLESLGLASSVPIIPKSDSVKRSEAFQAAMYDVIPKCTNEPVPAFSLSSPQQTHVDSFGSLTPPPTFNSSAEDETYNSPAHAVSVDTDLGLGEKFRSSTDDGNIKYDEMASPPKPILKTTSKAARVSDYIKHPSSSVLKAPFTPLALHSLASKTPVTTQRILNTQPRHIIESGASVSTPMLQLQPPFSVMVTPAVVLSARRVPVSSVPQIAKQFWELENEDDEEEEKTHQEENVMADQDSDFYRVVEENIAPMSLSKSSLLKKTSSLTTPISRQDQQQDVMTSGKGKASRKKTPKKTPAESSTRRSARLAGVSAENTDEDKIDDMMISLNSSLMNLAVSTVGLVNG